MDNEYIGILLNGMPFKHFIVWLGVAILGVLIFLILRAVYSVKVTKGTPNKWSWKLFWKGVLKTVANILILPFAIIYFSDYVPLVTEFIFDLGGVEIEGMIAEMNGLSAVIVGLTIDAVIRKGYKKYLQKK